MPSPDRFILVTDPDGLRRLGIPLQPATAVKLAKEGKFCPVTKISAHRTGWFESALLEWLESRKQTAQQAAA